MKDLELCRSENHDLHRELKSATGQLEQCQTEKSALEGYLKETNALLKSCEAKLGAAHTKLSQLEAVQGENKKLREKITVLDDKYHQCVVDKATFLEGLSPLIVDHLEEGARPQNLNDGFAFMAGLNPEAVGGGVLLKAMRLFPCSRCWAYLLLPCSTPASSHCSYLP